ncbi:MAG: nitroreductase/quinone reductase family protein [Proteobacteria bacterium]|nr:nitroreductase/quinone reductase family protein [Pseudomonadota bacterium]
MKAIKIFGIILAAYIGLVLVFESLLGYFQPADPNGTLVIRTTGADGSTNDRVLSRIDEGDQLYIASNHWFRDWYHDTLARPDVQVTYKGEVLNYLAIPVDDAEFKRLDTKYSRGPVFTTLMGFAPRYILKMEPR